MHPIRRDGGPVCQPTIGHGQRLSYSSIHEAPRSSERGYAWLSRGPRFHFRIIFFLSPRKVSDTFSVSSAVLFKSISHGTWLFFRVSHRTLPILLLLLLSSVAWNSAVCTHDKLLTKPFMPIVVRPSTIFSPLSILVSQSL